MQRSSLLKLTNPLSIRLLMLLRRKILEYNLMDFFLRTKRDVNDPFQAEQGISTPYFWQDGTNDLQVDTNGDFALVQGVNCLSQEMCKILVTERGSNLFFSLYGTNLQNLIGQKLSLQEVQAKVTTEVTDGLQIYQ